MGGRTKIGMGRTTRVKAVSVIAWGERWEHCAHASFQTLQWVGFNFPFMRSDVWEWQEPSRKWCIFTLSAAITFAIQWKKKKKSKCVNIFSAVKSQVRWVCKKKKSHSHVLQQFSRIPPRSRCRPAHRFLRTARCVSSGPRYRCLHSLRTGENRSFYNSVCFHKTRCSRQEIQSQIKRRNSFRSTLIKNKSKN